MKKSIAFVLLFVILCLCCCSCSGDRKVDLSNYDEHGEWSCGRIWVEKVEDGKDYIGYLDEKGQVVGEWHLNSEWIYPTDYSNGYAFVGTSEYAKTERTAKVTTFDIIDLNGDIVNQIQCISGSTGFDDAYYLPFNASGYAFYLSASRVDDIVYRGTVRMLKNDGSEISFDKTVAIFSKNSLKSFQGFFQEGCTYFANASGDNYYFNEAGETVLDLSDFGMKYFKTKYMITKLYPIKNRIAKVVFRPIDSSVEYIVALDLNGNLLTDSPIKYETFTESDFDNLKPKD